MATLNDYARRTPKVPWRRVALAGLLLAAAIAAAWGLLHTPRSAAPRHVILISLDTTRADHLGCYGNTWIHTPHLDALAAESILLTDYMTVVSTTLASHVSLFTGKYPHTHGVPRNGFVVHDDNVMLPEVLKAAGFHTAAFIGSFALDSRFNFAQGFEHFDAEFDMARGAGGVDQNQRRAQAVTDAVLRHLDRHGVPDRLFLFVHYFDPHAPYDPPPPFDALYSFGAGRAPPPDHPALARARLPQALQARLWAYAGEVSYMDAQVGRLLDDLRRRGVLDQALVIVTSDHGENLGENPGVPFDHGWTVYQCDVHAVAMFRLPGGQHGGTRLDLPAASIDVLPTVLKYLALPVPTGVEGRAIDLRRPPAQWPDRTRFGEATKPWHVEAESGWYNVPKARCVRDGPFKYVCAPAAGREQLFDLSSDPHEFRDLLGPLLPAPLARAGELRARLDAWTAAARPLPTHFERQRGDETIRRLKAMGYLEDQAGSADEPEP